MSLDYGLCIFLIRPISELKKEYSSMMFDPIPERNQYLIILNPKPLMQGFGSQQDVAKSSLYFHKCTGLGLGV